MNKLDWSDIQYFVCLVNEQTLTATAEVLDVQHSTVARRIDKLELALNLKLFDRVGKRYHLTSEGKLLFSQATKVQDSVYDFSRIASSRNTVQGNVTISAPPVLADVFIAQNLDNFYQQYPSLSLSIQGDTHMSNLYKQEADIAIRIGRPTQESFVIRKLLNIEYQLCSHKNFFTNLGRQEYLEKNLNFLKLTSNRHILDWTNELQKNHNMRTVISSNDLYIHRTAIGKGLGIGALPTFMVDSSIPIMPLLHLPYLKHVSIHEELLGSQILELYLVVHEDIWRSPKVRVVSDWLIAQFS